MWRIALPRVKRRLPIRWADTSINMSIRAGRGFVPRCMAASRRLKREAPPGAGSGGFLGPEGRGEGALEELAETRLIGSDLGQDDVIVAGFVIAPDRREVTVGRGAAADLLRHRF